MSGLALAASSSGRLPSNIVHFARLLRAAGLSVGTDRVLLALEALRASGLGSRVEFQAVLRCCLVDRAEYLPLFDQAFTAYWRDPDLLGRLLRLRLPQIDPHPRAPAPRSNQRLAASDRPAPPAEPGTVELGAELSWSDRERLRKADFDTMNSSEWRAARALVEALEPSLPRLQSRRRVAAQRGAVAMRAALRSMARHAGELPRLPRCRLRTRPSPLVLLIDISGSMTRYSRMLLHFAHALCDGEAAGARRIHVFVFGTRLSEITRRLAARDPDAAIDAVVRAVDDWAGGTRIAHALGEFNRHWLQRSGGSGGSGATVLLATDGLDHAAFEQLGAETRHLRLGCRRLLWLNPLLRSEQFEARARGMRAMLPHVDRLLPMHNVDALESLALVLGAGARHEDSPWR